MSESEFNNAPQVSEISGKQSLEQRRSTLGSNLIAKQSSVIQEYLRLQAESQQNPTPEKMAQIKVMEARAAVLTRLVDMLSKFTEEQLIWAQNVIDNITDMNAFKEVMQGQRLQHLIFSPQTLDQGLDKYPTLADICDILGIPKFNGTLTDALARRQVEVVGTTTSGFYGLEPIKIPINQDQNGQPSRTLEAQLIFKPVGQPTVDAVHALYIKTAA